MDFCDKTYDLIYDLIFSDESYFNIDISEHISDIYQYEEFILSIKEVLKKSKVKVTHSDVKIDSKTATWILKVKK